MDAFNADLNEALKYAVDQERAAFESRIDANPLDWQNHLVYSDWLRDNGEEEEADFRKAMGEWHQLHPNVFNRYGVWSVHPYKLPEGINHSHIPIRGLGAEGNEPHAAIGRGSGNYEWTEYRNMETAFRKSFNAGRSKGAN